MTALEQIAVVIFGGVGLIAARWLFLWTVKVVAGQIVKAINGQLGLDVIRTDVKILKGQVQNLEAQLEVILTDL